MKIWHSPLYTFKYNHDDVTKVFWNRYPNDFAKHIISEDVIERKVIGDQIITKKLIVKRGSSFLKMVPSWMTSLNSIKIMPVIEESIYDRKTKKLTTYTRNVAHREQFLVEERCVYTPTIGQARTSTDLQRSVFVDVNYGRISSIVQKFILMGFKKSVKNTVLGFNQILAKLTPTNPEKDYSFKEEMSSKIDLAKQNYKLLSKTEKQKLLLNFRLF
uniref:PRELI/MSF1 domain-containing protein n=1 Tax=Parastrongyloides trichosuri TaxID=131310 RepID=A0A0N4ZU52_PARTI